MNRTFVLGCATLALGMSLAGTCRAGNVTFAYDFTPTSPAIVGDGGHNQIDMSSQVPNTVTIASGSPGTDIVATNLTVHNGSSDTFKGTGVNAGAGVAYTLKLHLTDGAASTDLAYTGHIVPGSVITNGAPSLTNVFDTPHPPAFVLNGDTFDIQMLSFVSPNPYNPDPNLVTKGAIGFHVTVNGGNSNGGNGHENHDTPEPSTLLLSCLALGGLGFGAWRKRKMLA